MGSTSSHKPLKVTSWTLHDQSCRLGTSLVNSHSSLTENTHCFSLDHGPLLTKAKVCDSLIGQASGWWSVSSSLKLMPVDGLSSSSWKDRCPRKRKWGATGLTGLGAGRVERCSRNSMRICQHPDFHSMSRSLLHVCSRASKHLPVPPHLLECWLTTVRATVPPHVPF